MLLVLIAIALTCSAPLAVSALARLRPQAHPGCEEPLHLPGYAYLVLALLAAVGIVPQVMRNLGFGAFLPLGIGLGLPVAVRLWMNARRAGKPLSFRPLAAPRPAADAASLSLVALGLGGIVLHSFLDGAVLFSFGDPTASPLLAPLVLLDRVTLGFVAWALLLPLGGRLTGTLGLALIAGVTALGYAAFGFISGRLVGDPLVAWANAALSGIVLGLMVSHAVAHKRQKKLKFQAQGSFGRSENSAW